MSEEYTKNDQSEESSEFVYVPEYDQSEYDESQEKAINSRIRLTEEEMKKPEPIKMNLWQRISNFFYHYKWQSIVAVCTIIAVAYCLYISQIEPRDYDFRIYCGEQNFEDDLLIDEFNDYFSQYALDLDGNGEARVSVEYYDLTANQFYEVYDENGEPMLDEDGYVVTEPISKANPENYYEFIAASATLENDIKLGKSFIFIMDRNNYDAMKKEFDEELFVEFDGVSWIPLYESESFTEFCKENEISAQLGICLVAKSEKTEQKEDRLARWNQAYEYMLQLKKAIPEIF